jgi:protein-tyrosine phosphatase
LKLAGVGREDPGERGKCTARVQPLPGFRGSGRYAPCVLPPRFKVLVVCMANVCRSPMAESVLRAVAAEHGRVWLEVESAGTRVTRTGLRPDPRAEEALLRRGYSASGSRSRALVPSDFDRFDLLLAMDRTNLADMLAIGPPIHHVKARLLLDCAPDHPVREVPDPYFGSAEGFEHVLDLCEAGARGLLRLLSEQSGHVLTRQRTTRAGR